MPNKMKEFRGMSDEQLALTLKETEKHLFKLRFQSATDRLETPSEIRKAKRDIARLLGLGNPGARLTDEIERRLFEHLTGDRGFRP